ncbi:MULTISPECIES: hypothetical protein [unclassified Psychrobacter]|uniref:hypothetical protein n=1 Tax=unclassified Psychrobacter TaxID=196806 RepID=UPI003FB92506
MIWQLNSDMESLYGFVQMARIPTHVIFGKHKSEVIADLATSSEGACYINWRLKQDSIDPYLAQVCKQAFELA